MSAERDNVTIFMEELVNRSSNPTPPTIFIVDHHLRQVKEEDYEPEIVSIGPIHHGKKRYERLEEDKATFLRELLEERPDLSMDKLVEKLREMEASARQCYPNSLDLDTDKFVEMLLLDGCFIILFERQLFKLGMRHGSDLLSRIRCDLMLLENQLPFFVLKHLHDMIKTDDPEDNLHRIIISHFSKSWHFESMPSFQEQIPPPNHLLGLVHRTFSPISARDWKVKSFGTVHINSASELKEAGIKLKRSRDNSLTFTAGVLNLPPLYVSRTTESRLRNLMAYEQLQLDDDHPKYVTNYLRFIHFLIRSTKDMEILRRKKIICSRLGSDDKTVQMFDRLEINSTASSRFCYSHVFESVNEHCRRRRNTWMAKLQRNYLNSPWSVVQFLAATLLLRLTIVQAVSSILSLRDQKTF